MEQPADLDAAADEVLARGVDVLGGQDQPLDRARLAGRQPRAERDRARRERRGELDHPEILAPGDVGVEPPPKALVERLRPINV